MKTRTMFRARARQVATSFVLVLAAAVFVSGAAIGSDPDSQPVDQTTQASWLYDHFCCEHATEMAQAMTVDQTMIVDQTTQASWLYDHFCCEHASEMSET